MVAVAVVASNLRREDMEGAMAGDTNIGAGAGGNAFTESFYQGGQSWGRKAGAAASQRGFFIAITSIDMTAAANKVWMSKTSIVNAGQLDTYANGGGLRTRIGSSTSNYYEYALSSDQGDAGSSDLDYGGRIWRIAPIDPSVSAWVDLVTTAPTLTAVVALAVTGSVTATTNLENVLMDAADFNAGMWMTGGTGADAPGVFEDFVADDEGDQTNGRIGNIFTQDSIIFVYGTLTAGRNATPTSSATRLIDELRTLVFPGGLVDAGWNGLYWDLATSGSLVTLTNMNYIGRGRDPQTRYFDSSADEVDGTLEELVMVGHGYATGDAVLYDALGGTAVSGLTTATEYFIERISADRVALHTTRQAALTLAAPINLTAAGTGETHKLTRQPDTRPVQAGTGTTGAYLETGSVFQRFASFTTLSSWTYDSVTFVECGLIDVAAGATLTDCVVTGSLVDRGDGAVTCADMDDITGLSITAGPDGGHGVIRTGTAGTDAVSGFSFNGYWTHGGDPGDGAVFSTSATGVDGTGEDVTTTFTHGFTTGDFVYYNDNGGAASIGLTDGAGYYVNVISTTNVSFHVTKADAVADANRVGLTASGTETHTLYSQHAAVRNSTGGAMTFNVSNGDTPYVRNVGAATSTVSNPVTATVTGLVAGTEVRINRISDNVELAGIESSGTSFAYPYEYGGDVDVKIVIQKLTHKWKRIDVTLTSSNQSILAGQIPDPDYENP